jgi:hypothetical protein
MYKNEVDEMAKIQKMTKLRLASYRCELDPNRVHTSKRQRYTATQNKAMKTGAFKRLYDLTGHPIARSDDTVVAVS